MQDWQPLTRDHESERAYLIPKTAFTTYDEIWTNDIYMVFVTRTYPNNPPNTPFMTWLSIKRHDKEPCNDWRDFQFIKNQLVGEDCEAAQLYPAEARLVDGSNQYHLFCLTESTMRFPFGFFDGRMVTETPFENGKQRPWPDNMKPPDLAEHAKKVREYEKQYRDHLTKANGNGNHAPED